MTKTKKVTGPASYFPSIEKKYGKPISHWLKVLGTMKDMKHMEMVAALKTKHEMGAWARERARCSPSVQAGQGLRSVLMCLDRKVYFWRWNWVGGTR